MQRSISFPNLTRVEEDLTISIFGLSSSNVTVLDVLFPRLTHIGGDFVVAVDDMVYYRLDNLQMSLLEHIDGDLRVEVDSHRGDFGVFALPRLQHVDDILIDFAEPSSDDDEDEGQRQHVVGEGILIGHVIGYVYRGTWSWATPRGWVSLCRAGAGYVCLCTCLGWCHGIVVQDVANRRTGD